VLLLLSKARVRRAVSSFVLHNTAFDFRFLVHHVNTQTEVARIFGTDATPNGLKFQFTDRFRPVARRQLDMLAAGQDPKDINLDDCKPTKGGKGQANFLPRVSFAQQHTSILAGF
jgi:hypothetical protein